MDKSGDACEGSNNFKYQFNSDFFINFNFYFLIFLDKMNYGDTYEACRKNETYFRDYRKLFKITTYGCLWFLF